MSTYKDAGVDIDAGDRAVELMKASIAKASRPEVMGGIGGFAGLFDDQKYLDLVPVIFENVEVVKHRGCNFAGWNCDEVALNSKEEVLYIDNDKLVFIHFAQLSMERFSEPKSDVHGQYIQYLNALKSNHPSYEFRGKKRSLLSFSAYFYYLRWKLVRLFEN